MSNNSRELIVPTDSIVVGRRMRTISAENVAQRVDAAITATNASERGLRVSAPKYYSAGLVEPEEFAKKKLTHKVLGVWSTIKLVDNFETFVKEADIPDLDAFTGAKLGEVDYKKIDEGKFVVGYLFDSNFEERLAEERKAAIDIILDATELSLTDPVLQWRNEEPEDLWLPVLTVRAQNDKDTEPFVENFADTLEDSTGSLGVEFYEVKARRVIADVAIEI